MTGADEPGDDGEPLLVAGAGAEVGAGELSEYEDPEGAFGPEASGDEFAEEGDEPVPKIGAELGTGELRG